MRIKRGKILSSVVLCALIFTFIVPCVSISAQTLTYDYSINYSVLGHVYTPAGKNYSAKVVVLLKYNTPGQANDGRIVDLTFPKSGQFYFIDIERGNYRVEIFYEKDLLNPNIIISPLYTSDVSLYGTSVNLGNITLPEPIKCAKGETFYFENRQARCAVLTPRQVTLNDQEIEDMMFAFVNYNRKRSKLSPFAHYEPLKQTANEIVHTMAVNNSIYLDSQIEGGYLGFFNANNLLPSDPKSVAMMLYRYNRISSTGIPTSYITGYYIASKFAKKAPLSKMKDYNYFESSIEISNDRIFVYLGGIPDFTDTEKLVISSIVNELISNVASDREKITKIHDWITDNIAYDTRRQKISYTSVGAFRNRRAVCSGYSELFRYMLIQAGLDSDVVYGWAGARHAWNKVTLNGLDYYIDTTWDAGYVSRRQYVKSPSYTYFLIPETCIKVDHYVNKSDRVRNRTAYIAENQSLFQEQCSGLFAKYSNTR